jgi:hypothetical protein
VNFTFLPAGVFWNAAMSFAYAGCGVEYATRFNVTLPPAAAEPAGVAAALALGGVAAADEAAADLGAAAAEEAVDEAAVVDGAVVDFDELHPAAKSRPVAASTPRTR